MKTTQLGCNTFVTTVIPNTIREDRTIEIRIQSRADQESIQNGMMICEYIIDQARVLIPHLTSVRNNIPKGRMLDAIKARYEQIRGNCHKKVGKGYEALISNPDIN